MSIVFMCCCTTLTLLFAGFTGDLSEVSSQRTRAQTAADSAALAAAVESTIAGSGNPREIARFYASANGAELVACRCEPGSLRVHLVVAFGHIRATASAQIDPSLLRPAAAEGAGRLSPQMAAAVAALEDASGGAVWIGSGFRDRSQQTALWSQALRRYGDPEVADDWVARPGASLHERGMAVDLEGDLTLAATLVEQLGLPLYRPLANEPWHFELVGSRS